MAIIDLPTAAKDARSSHHVDFVHHRPLSVAVGQPPSKPDRPGRTRRVSAPRSPGPTLSDPRTRSAGGRPPDTSPLEMVADDGVPITTAIAHLEKTMTMVPDDRISSALTDIGPRLGAIATRTLGLMLALCLAGLAGLLTFDAVAAAFGFVVAGGLIISRVIVGNALGRICRRDQRNRSPNRPA